MLDLENEIKLLKMELENKNAEVRKLKEDIYFKDNYICQLEHEIHILIQAS
jgi:hypothetical protein